MSNSRILFLQVAILSLAGAACTSDTSLGTNSLDGDVVECAPGYGVGSTRPAGDGCNTCTCSSNGQFVCGMVLCLAPDAGSADSPVECAPGYAVGSTRPSSDGCNTCTCMSSGQFACTEKACFGPDARGADSPVECAPGYGVGSTRPSSDGCNTCTCMASGQFACTLMGCLGPDARGADSPVECAPGYGVGSTRPSSDSCNTCTCMSSGQFICTLMPCLAPDAGADAPICPAGQRWCAGCTPGTGSCGQVCPAIACVADAGSTGDAIPVSCSQLTTQGACEARSDCHPVFHDPGTCGCATKGCCARFSACADGGKATCTMPTTMACTVVTPFCESPYVLSYTKICYEGCVLQSECAP
jgi:hypothetical protein